MAVHCPRCQAELPQDSGLVLCPSCGHPSILDANGQLQESSGGLAPVHEEEASAHELPPPIFDLSHDPGTVPETPVQNLDFDAQADQAPTPPPSEFQLFQSHEEAPQIDPFANMNQAPHEEINISEYANSEFSQGKNGAFVYNVSISDIDSKEIRDFLREAINDTRFNWDAQAILSGIKKGELLLKNLSPVKASILINRIKRLPVKIRWEQYAITQAEQDISTP